MHELKQVCSYVINTELKNEVKWPRMQIQHTEQTHKQKLTSNCFSVLVRYLYLKVTYNNSTFICVSARVEIVFPLAPCIFGYRRLHINYLNVSINPL